MGRLIGNTATMAGQNIQVAFWVDEFEDGELPPIVSINTQMDGGGEYSPLKITTASITFLVNGVELIKLCVVDYPIKVYIDNVATQTTIFQGYIVPNSLNQSLSGMNDAITIECVDRLGYSKYVPYSQYHTPTGFGSLRLDDVIFRCLRLIGVDTTSGHELIMLPDNVRVWRAHHRDMNFTNLEVSEADFFKSDLPDELTKDYRPNAMTCEEVLTMIAESFHLTWMCVNSNVILYEALSNSLDYTDLVRNDIVTLPTIRNINEDDFATTACNVSSLPRVSMTEVHHERVDSIQVQQDPFNNSTLHRDGNYDIYYNQSEDPEKSVVSTPLVSDIYNTYGNIDSDCYSKFVAWRTINSAMPAMTTPTSIGPWCWGDGEWTVALKICDNAKTELKELLRRKIKYTTPAIGNPGGTAPYAARTLHIAAQVVVAQLNEGEKDPEGKKLAELNKRLWPKNEKNIDCKLLVSVLLKGYYFNPEDKHYTSEKIVFPVNVREDGTADWDIYGINDRTSGIPVPAPGQLEFIVYSVGKYSAAGWSVAWLKNLKLTMRSSDWALSDDLAIKPVERVGGWDCNRVQSITELPFDIHYNMTSRPVYIPPVEDIEGDLAYIGAPRLEYNIDGKEMTLCEYAHALANKGDRLMWEITLRDEANALSPLDAFTCSKLWEGLKMMTGYTRDVINNQLTVTLV